MSSLAGCYLTAFLVLVADQAAKAWALHAVGPGRYIPLAGETLGVRLAHNTGAAFGLFPSGGVALAALTTVAVGVMVFYARKVGSIHRRMFPALALMLGGALGNLVDRVRFGHVVDFIYVSFWPTFNVADAAITIGVALFAWCLLTAAPRPENGPRAEEEKV